MKLHIQAWLVNEDDEYDAYPAHKVVIATEGTDAREAMEDQVLSATSTICRLLREDLREKITVFGNA